MALAQEDIDIIQSIVDKAIKNTPELKNGNVRYEIDLRERTIRVEEELKHQRELMLEGFKQMDKRFEAMQLEMNKRFEQVDNRFEAMQLEMNKRFEQVDKRFEQVDKRFEQFERRFDRFMFWSLGITVSCAVFVVNYLK